MKVYYFNDEYKDINIQVQFQTKLPDGSLLYGSKYVTVPARNAKIIEFDAPQGAIPYIKRWETRQCLIGYLDKETAEAMEEADVHHSVQDDQD